MLQSSGDVWSFLLIYGARSGTINGSFKVSCWPMYISIPKKIVHLLKADIIVSLTNLVITKALTKGILKEVLAWTLLEERTVFKSLIDFQRPTKWSFTLFVAFCKMLRFTHKSAAQLLQKMCSSEGWVELLLYTKPISLSLNLTIPKKVMTISKRWMTIILHVFWDIRNNPRKHAFWSSLFLGSLGNFF